MPVPFVLRVPFDGRARLALRPGDSFEFEMVIVGRANLDLPYYVLALADLGRVGLGPLRHRFRLDCVAAWTAGGFVTVWEGGDGCLRTDVPSLTLERLLELAQPVDGDRLTLRFCTPTRVDLRGDLVYPVEFEHLVRALVERWRALAACYGGRDLGEVPLALARQVHRVVDRTRWADFARYSTRQRSEMRMGGAVGLVTYKGADFSAFGQLLAFGEWLGVGKLTSMGFGRMEVVRG
jgi:CRISPR-associated endoribonuclease Cas6